MQTWVLRSPANIWVSLRCHPSFGDVNQIKGGKRNNLSQTCKHELAETVFNMNGWIDQNDTAYVVYLKSEMKKHLNASRYRVDMALEELEKCG